MTKKRIRAAIIGCGKIAGIKDHPRDSIPIKTHAQAYHQHPDFELVATCDVDPDALHLFNANWNIEHGFLDIRDLNAREVPDVISICSPTIEHFRQLEILLQAASPPKVIFVEKPICNTVVELDRLDELNEDRKVTLLANHTRRFDPKHRDLADLIQKKTFGDLVMGHCYYYGGWLNNGTHLIDTLRMLFAEEPVGPSVLPGKPGRPNDPCWDVQLNWGDAPVSLQSFDENYYQLFEMNLFFENGRILIKDFGGSIIIEEREIDLLDQRILEPLPSSPWRGLETPLYYAVDAMAKFLKGKGSLEETGATLPEVRKTMRIVWDISDTLGVNYAN